MYHVTCTLFSFPHINITSNFLSRRKTSKHNQGAKIFRTRFYNQIRIILNHKGDGSSSSSKLSSKEIAHLQVQIMIFGPFRPYSSFHSVHSIFIMSLRTLNIYYELALFKGSFLIRTQYKQKLIWSPRKRWSPCLFLVQIILFPRLVADSKIVKCFHFICLTLFWFLKLFLRSSSRVVKI